jgi:hypothetical protein
MTYWTILWITVVGGQIPGAKSYLLYPSLEECRAAVLTVTSTLPYDYTVRCEETDTPSGAPVRPKKNPRY